jgi:hypothetical protein
VDSAVYSKLRWGAESCRNRMFPGTSCSEDIISAAASRGAAGGVGSPRLVERFLVREGSGQLQAATFGNGSYLGGGRSSPPSAAATAGSTLDSGSGAGRSISMADLLQQLQSGPSSKGGWGSACACIRHMHESAACLEGVALDAIPASLLLTNYIAEVGGQGTAVPECRGCEAAGCWCQGRVFGIIAGG